MPRVKNTAAITSLAAIAATAGAQPAAVNIHERPTMFAAFEAFRSPTLTSANTGALDTAFDLCGLYDPIPPLTAAGRPGEALPAFFEPALAALLTASSTPSAVNADRLAITLGAQALPGHRLTARAATSPGVSLLDSVFTLADR